MTKTLIKGTGPKLVKGQFVVVQYTGEIWRTKKVFDSSWTTRRAVRLRHRRQPRAR